MVECFARTQHLLAVVLVDESSSLNKTDPGDLRVGMVEALTDALIYTSRITKDDIPSELDLALVGFSSSVSGPAGEPVAPADWIRVSEDRQSEIDSIVLGFAERQAGSETDYVTALQGAQDLLIRRQAELGKSSDELCTVILWFTDGELSLEVNSQTRTWTADLDLRSQRDQFEAARRGQELLCESGGVADQLRAAGTYLLTFALQSDRFTGDKESLLRGVTVGDGGCGALDASSTGEYFANRIPADMADCFYIALQGFSCGDDRPPPTEQCSATGPCVTSFTVDDSIDQVKLEFFAEPDLENVVLRAPNGTELSLAGDDIASIAGVETRVQSATRAGFATMTIPEGETRAYGSWSVVNRPDRPGALRVEVEPRPSYRLLIDAPGEIVRGEPTEVTALLAGRSGQPIDPMTVAGLQEVTVSVRDGDSESRVNAELRNGAFVAELVLALDGEALIATTVATAEILSDEGEVRTIGSASRTAEVISPGFIRFSSELDLGVLEAERAPDSPDDHSQLPKTIESVTGEVEFQAPRDVGGTACFEPAQLVVGGKGASLEPGQECVTLAARGSDAVGFSLALPDPVAGPVQFEVPVVVTSDLDGSVKRGLIRVEGQVRIPPPVPWSDTGFRILLFIIGLLLPALAFLWSVRLSRFNNATLVQFASRPATITPAGLDVKPHQGDRMDLAWLEELSDRRVAGGVLTFDAPPRLISQPIARVSSAVPGALSTSESPTPTEARSAIRHDLNGQWVFIGHSQEGDNIVGELTVMTRETSDAESAILRIIDEAAPTLANQREAMSKILSTDDDGEVESVGDSTSVVDPDVDW